jgi:hypothetical protein
MALAFNSFPIMELWLSGRRSKPTNPISKLICKHLGTPRAKRSFCIYFRRITAFLKNIKWKKRRQILFDLGKWEKILISGTRYICFEVSGRENYEF